MSIYYEQTFFDFLTFFEAVTHLLSKWAHGLEFYKK